MKISETQVFGVSVSSETPNVRLVAVYVDATCISHFETTNVEFLCSVVADTEVVGHENAEVNFIDDVGESNDGFTNYKKKVYDHGKAKVGFIGNIVESDYYLTDNERNNIHADEDRGKAEIGTIEDAGRCNDVFT
ncbi:hypothetical protein GJ496_009662 [Pomphorhynchus laevis]|nr:hypothetical protein GJ496_009662 [Pomphorhynchus laevis]